MSLLLPTFQVFLFIVVVSCVVSLICKPQRVRLPLQVARAAPSSVFKLLGSTSNEGELPSPALPIESIAAKWRIVSYGQGGAKVTKEIEVQDRKYRFTSQLARVSRVGGIGLDLAEFPINREGQCIVLVNDIFEGSNAEKCQGFHVGDALVEARGVNSATEDTTKGSNTATRNLEGLSLDETLNALSQLADYPFLEFRIKRIVPRSTVKIEVVGPNGEFACEPIEVLSGFGSNLRTLLQVKGLKLYDSRTARFDSPYETGNCGGEGTCGTCMVAVLSGAELANNRVQIEDNALKRLGAPPQYRWSCRMKVASREQDTGTIKIKLRPQSQKWT